MSLEQLKVMPRCQELLTYFPSFYTEATKDVARWNSTLRKIQSAPRVTAILGARTPASVLGAHSGDPVKVSSIPAFLEVYDVPSAFRVVDYTDKSKSNPVITPSQQKQLDAIRDFDTNVTPTLARQIILAYNRLGSDFASQQYWIRHISSFLSTQQKQVLIRLWFGLPQRPAAIEMPNDVFSLAQDDVVVLLYSCIQHATPAEQETLQKTAIAQIEARVRSTFAAKLWKGTWGATVFFSQFDLVLRELGLLELVQDFPATERAYVDLLMRFLPVDGQKAVVSTSQSSDKDALRKLANFTAAVQKWFDVRKEYQLQQESIASVPDHALRRWLPRGARVSTADVAVGDGVPASYAHDEHVNATVNAAGARHSSQRRKCCGCGGDHWFMEPRGDIEECKYRITCDKRYPKQEFNRYRAAAFKHLFKREYKPVPDLRQRLEEFPRKIRKRLAMALLECTAHSDDEDDSVASPSLSDPDDSDCASCCTAGSVVCTASVHAVTVNVNAAAVSPDVLTYALFNNVPYAIARILHDSGAQATLIGNEFLQALVGAGVFRSFADAVAALQPSGVEVQVSGVHGHAVSSKKYMLVDFAIALYSKETQPEERITLRQVACYYHPQFPTVLGEPALRAAGLMPDQNVSHRLGHDVIVPSSLIPIPVHAAKARTLDLPSLCASMPHSGVAYDAVPEGAVPTADQCVYGVRSAQFWLSDLA